MKMDDSAKSGSRLEVSVSFGRFENDALSWEKWSSFSPNKYLEEVGSLSTPGSVAQKKAYFEAHYKKIAARKPEELEQEQSTNSLFFSPDMPIQENHVVYSSENGIEFSLSNERLVDEVVEEACWTALTNTVIADEEKDNNTATSSKEEEHVASINGVIDKIGLEEEMTASVAVESGNSADQEATGATDINVDNPELNVGHDASLVVLKTCEKDSRCVVKEPPERKKGLKQSNKLKKESSKMNSRSSAQKVTPINKESNLSATRKKVVSSPAKPLPETTPRNAKPTSISTPISAPQSLKKKVNNSAPPKSKSSQVMQSKRVAPTSLHMSLALDPVNSLGALPMTRKSLIMESMGDKDIVKRAFKTFLYRTNGFASNEKPSTAKHVSTASCEPKTSSYHTPTKGNEGLIKDAEKRASQRSESRTRSNPLSSGLRKSIALDKKSLAALSPATGLRTDEKAEKRKEFLKKDGIKINCSRDTKRSTRCKIKGGS